MNSQTFQVSASNLDQVIYQANTNSWQPTIQNTTQDIYPGYIGDPIPNYWPTWYDRVYYPVYGQLITYEKNKIEEAFKITDLLMREKLVEIRTAKQFSELVNKIAKIL